MGGEWQTPTAITGEEGEWKGVEKRMESMEVAWRSVSYVDGRVSKAPKRVSAKRPWEVKVALVVRWSVDACGDAETLRSAQQMTASPASWQSRAKAATAVA
jgi:hypothetical protein